MIKYIDISAQRINSLDPRLIPTATSVFQRCLSENIPIYITWGKRSIQEQDLMYSFGRTLPGPIMTSKRGGYSAHNYAMALDFCFTTKDKILTWEDVHSDSLLSKKWWKVIDYFEEQGWESGWRWSSFEPSHVENLLGNTIGELYNFNMR